MSSSRHHKHGSSNNPDVPVNPPAGPVKTNQPNKTQQPTVATGTTGTTGTVPDKPIEVSPEITLILVIASLVLALIVVSMSAYAYVTASAIQTSINQQSAATDAISATLAPYIEAQTAIQASINNINRVLTYNDGADTIGLTSTMTRKVMFTPGSGSSSSVLTWDAGIPNATSWFLYNSGAAFEIQDHTPTGTDNHYTIDYSTGTVSVA